MITAPSEGGISNQSWEVKVKSRHWPGSCRAHIHTHFFVSCCVLCTLLRAPPPRASHAVSYLDLASGQPVFAGYQGFAGSSPCQELPLTSSRGR